MIDDVGSKVFEDLGQRLVADIVLVELDSWVEVGRVAGRQIVDDRDFVPLRAEPIGDMRADKASPAGDKNSHG
jgi:hypothetical protein